MPHLQIQNINFADPIVIDSPTGAAWYQYFNWPDGSKTRGRLDYREKVDDYLGHFDFKDKTVLEIGPASGFLSKEMDARGGAVTCIDLPDDRPWEAVPRSDMDVEAEIRAFKGSTYRQRAAWWYAQRQFQSKARVAYCGIEGLEKASIMGDARFDVALIASVLQHMRDPIGALYTVARMTNAMIVSELYFDHAEATKTGAYFVPSQKNKIWATWWALSSGLIEQVLSTAGFTRQSFNKQTYRIWDLKTSDDATDSFVDRQFHISVYVRQ